MHEDLSPILHSFTPITLAEMDNVKLLDRTDTKFIFNYNKLPFILESLSEHYKVLDINGLNQSRYESLYFDTPGFKLYLDHHNGRTNRYKVRYRKYADSGLVFFEVKLKNHKGRTIKSRIKRDSIFEMIEGRSAAFINEKTPLEPTGLESKLWVNYSRITLVNRFSPERLTMDIDLQFKNKDRVRGFENLVIAEVKQEKAKASYFMEIMKKNHIRKGSISKYCFGVVSLINDIKKNNFKPKLLTVNKVCHESDIQICA